MLDPAAVPVLVWRTSSTVVDAIKVRRLGRRPVAGVVRHPDIPYADDPACRLDVLVPARPVEAAPVLLFFHGGGWTNGGRRVVDAYCATVAAGGAVVVNADYPLAGRQEGDHLRRVLTAAGRALAWTREHAGRYGGDPGRIVVGGESAGGQVAAVLVAAQVRPEIAARLGIEPAGPPVRGLVQHSSFADLVPERWSAPQLLVRLLLPDGGRGMGPAQRRDALRACSPVDLVTPDLPPVLVTTSSHDVLKRASLTLIDRLHGAGVPVEALVLGRAHDRALHSFQQDPSRREAQLVHEHLHRFLLRVTR